MHEKLRIRDREREREICSYDLRHVFGYENGPVFCEAYLRCANGLFIYETRLRYEDDPIIFETHLRS
jgi:hypothetical protein